MGVDIDVLGQYNTALPDGNALAQFHAALAGKIASGDAIVVDGANDMVTRIQSRLGPGLKIRRLRIIGHGGPGVQGLGRLQHSPLDITTGRTALHWADSTRIIMVVNGQLLSNPPLGNLRGRFGPDGWVELHGCQVASGSKGAELLRALAALWGVPVQGSTALQHVGGGLEGQVFVAQPTGRVEMQHR